MVDKRKNLLILLLFVLPPFLFAFLHVKAITIQDSGIIPVATIIISQGGNNDLPKDNPQDISKVEFRVRDESGGNLIPKLDNISRHAFLLDMQPNVIRHELIVEHNLSIIFEYSDNPNGQNIKKERFPFTLSCMGDEIIDDKFQRKGLKLNDEDDNDRKLVEGIIENCLYFPFGGFHNTIGKTIYLYPDKSSQFEGSIDLTIKPDFTSKIIILLSWFILWCGSWVILRDGPYRYFKKIE